MIYGNKIKELRTYEGIKQTELVKIIGVSNASYSEFEREKTIIPLKYLIEICNYFDVSIDYVFSFSNIKQYKDIKKDINLIEVGERFKEFRNSLKKSQAGFCLLFNISRSSLSGYEIGKFLIPTSLLYDICKKYNISADYLLGRIDKPIYFK